MKTIEYPIKELVRFEMDENKIWRLRYNNHHECFPKITTVKTDKWGNRIFRNNKKGYEDFVYQTYKFCEEQNFLLEYGGFCMVNNYHQNVSWSNKNVLGNRLPYLLFPKVILKIKNYPSGIELSVFGYPVPYYGNPHYKKYIEDNNGECLLPFPKDVEWGEE